MKTLSLAEAHALLSKASAVMVDGDGVCPLNMAPLGRDRSYWLQVVADSGTAYFFTLGDNETVTLDGCEMTLKAHRVKAPIKLTLLFPRDLEATPAAPDSLAPVLDHLVKAVAPFVNAAGEGFRDNEVRLRGTEQDLFALRLTLSQAETELARRSVGQPSQP